MSDFSALGMSEPLLQAVRKLGFASPTPIQEKVIPALLATGRNVVALARTGTGKTAAFGIPLLQKLDLSAPGPQALVLSPTRELCRQIAKDLSEYSSFMDRVRILPVYGGAGMDTQIRGLRAKPHIVVATPGRLIDHLTRGNVNLSGVSVLVLDEADEMLSMGFKDELEEILSKTPEQKQTCLFSATMPREIREISGTYLDNALEISAVAESEVKIEHRFALVHSKDRIEALRRFIASEPSMYGIVFCRTKETAKNVADIIATDGFQSDALHGDLPQTQRDYVMNRFRTGVIRVLIATDVAARGLDVNDLSHVVHYELPDDVEGYVHRSGRTGRAGKEGISLALVSPRELSRLKRLEYALKVRFEKAEVPSGKEIILKRASDFVDRLQEAPVDEELVETFLEAARERLAGMPHEELVTRFLHLELRDQVKTYGTMGRLAAPGDHGPRPRTDRGYYRADAGAGRGHGAARERGRPFDRDRSGDDRWRERGGERRPYRERSAFTGRTFGPRPGFSSDRRDRFEGGELVGARIPYGKDSGMTPKRILELVNKSMGRTKFPVGAIRITRNASFIEVPEHVARDLAGRFETEDNGGAPGL